MDIHISNKEKLAISLLALQAIACIIAILSPVTMGDIFPFVMAFPYAPVGLGLRVLSLSGAAGNIIAIVLYVAVCLLPMAALLFIRSKKTEDAMLPLISMVLFFVIYFMINPGTLQMAGGVHFQQAVLGGIVHSLVLAYFIIKILRLFSAASATELGRYIGVVLHLLNVLFVLVAFGITFGRMLDAFAALRAGNVGNNRLGATYVFLVLQHIVNALPYVLNIWVVFVVLRLLTAFRADRYSQETVAAARGVSWVCTAALVVTVLSGAGFNLLQLLSIRRLFVVNSNINFPVISVLFVLGALLLTRYIAENKLLKDENEQFI